MGFFKNLLKVNELSIENKKLKDQFLELSKEYTKLKKDYSLLETRVSELEKSYKEVYAPQKTESPAYNDQEIDDSSVVEKPKRIIPKALNMSGFESVSYVIDYNLSVLGDSYYLSRFTYICDSLFVIGKELIFKKITDSSKIEEDSTFNTDIVKLARSVIETDKNGDIDVHNRALSAFNEKSRIKPDFFDNEYPADFFPSEEMTSYECCCYLYQFLSKWKEEILQSINTTKLFDICDKTQISNLFTGNLSFIVEHLFAISYLRQLGYTICIVPIFDENIMYRPQSAAQDNKYLSLLYSDKYWGIDYAKNQTTTSVVERVLKGASK